MFKYGERVTDTVTGYTGKVTARCEYYGRRAPQYLVESMGNSGHSEEWIDEYRLEPVLTEHRNCCYIPEAEMVQEIPLGADPKEIEKNLGAILNAKA